MAKLTRLRNRRLGYAVAIATAAALTGTLTSAVPASSQDDGFDINHDNVLLEVVYPKFQPVSREQDSGRAVSLTVDLIMLIELPWFDAIAPYHPTAEGIFSDMGRRPESEHTTRNQNIAVTYAAFTSLNAVLPQYKSRWIEMMNEAGLDPDNTAEDPSTPSGIGIIAAKKAIAARQDDGSNRYGDLNGRKYHKRPYSDYTGYRPVNTAYELRDPSRWQPNTSSARGVYKDQQFATPHYGRVRPFTYDSPTEFKVPPPVSSNHHNRRAYKRQADEVLKASANLTDEQKAAAEVFDDKVLSLGRAATAVVAGGDFNTEEAVHYVTMTDVAFVDVTIATWYYKRKFDSVRPGSAIAYLYGDEKVTAWGGPGQGTVDDITGGEWEGYLDSVSADHPEYPSASSALCLALAAQVPQLTGTDEIKITAPFPKGSSVVEPGVTPSSDITLQWNSWTEYADACGESRIWAGENFRSSVEAAEHYAPEIGDMSYEFVQRKLNGG